MSHLPLTGAQRSRLRGIGQTLEASIKIGQAGASPQVIAELNRLLGLHELVKVRYVGADREQRAAISATLPEQAACEHIGSVGATALFYRQNPVAEKRRIIL